MQKLLRLIPVSCGFMFLLATGGGAEENAPAVEVSPAAQEEPVTETGTASVQPEQKEQTFTIRRFVIEGSGIFSNDELQKQVKQFVGREKTAADVEGARDALERFFHDQGYPTVLVNIPEQSVQNRVIRLDVIENRVGTVKVTGNRWFSTEKIIDELPSLAPGRVIRLQQLQVEVNRLNRNPDFKVVPDMQPGVAPESVDLTLKVEEKFPLHGSLELNNRSSHDTTALRLNAALRYDNLWQREHSLSLQYQTAPEKPGEVQVVSSSYTLPALWDHDDKLVVYGVLSNTDTASAAGFNNIGKGNIIGLRAIIPLQGVGEYNHTAVLGFDYKDFQETVGLAGSTGIKTPVTYFPFSLAYSSSLRDDSGVTSFNTGVNIAFRGMVTNPHQFEDKRFKARGNYISLTAGAERSQKLPGDFSMLVRLDGQLADQPLIANEQFVAGGVESVRGYRESEVSGDNAIHGVFELAGPNLLKSVGKDGFNLTPYLFFDAAALWVKEPLPGQDDATEIEGTGFGLRGTLFGGFEFQTDYGFALRDTNRIASGDSYLHFKVKYQF